MQQAKGFTASNYRPQEWAALIKESGAKYAVITTKHHDGFALWNSSALNNVNSVKNSPAKRDLISPFVQEIKKKGIKTGLYFSLPDWSHPDYDIFTRERKRYSIQNEPIRWQRYINYYQTQLNELSNQFNPDLMWFDGDWEHSSAEWQTEKAKALLLAKNPNLIVNARLDAHGDYETPEQGVPVNPPKNKFWELCYTMNDSWGFQPFDTHYKSPNMIIRTLVDCISMGGNLLLDIGPKADGTIPQAQQHILKQLGRWTSKHAEAIYRTKAGIEEGHFNGKTTRSLDDKTLFLYADYKNENGFILRNVASKIDKISIVGKDVPVKFEKIGTDSYLIKVPSDAYDTDVTVIKVAFQEKIKLKPHTPAKLNLQQLFAYRGDKNFLYLDSVARGINDGLNPLSGSHLTFDGFEAIVASRPQNLVISQWLEKNAEALYKPSKGIPAGHFNGSTTLSSDRKTLYLFVEGIPSGPISIKGLKNQISRIRIVGEGSMLNHQVYNKLYWSKVPGIVYIDIPKSRLDKQLTVISVLLDGEIELNRENVGAITSNE